MPEILSYNPSNNALIGSQDATPVQKIEDFVLEARDAFLLWKKTPLTKRVEILRGVYLSFIEKKEELAQSVASEM